MSLFNQQSIRPVYGISLSDIGSAAFGDFGGITGADDAAEAAIRGTTKAGKAILQSTRENIDFQKWLWGEQKDLAQPYADLGTGAIPKYLEGLDADVELDPGYQFGMNEGTRAMENSASAKGMQLSGAQLKAMQRFGTDYGSTKYNEAFNRRQVNLDNLYRMITTGQAAAAGQAATGSQMGAQVGSSIREGGQAQAQMYSDVGNIQSAQAMSNWNTLLDLGNMASNFYRPKTA